MILHLINRQQNSGVRFQFFRMTKKVVPVIATQKVHQEMCSAKMAMGNKLLASMKKNFGDNTVSLHILLDLPFFLDRLKIFFENQSIIIFSLCIAEQGLAVAFNHVLDGRNQVFDFRVEQGLP